MVLASLLPAVIFLQKIHEASYKSLLFSKIRAHDELTTRIVEMQI